VVIVKPGFLGLPAAAAVLRTARACGLDAVITSALDTSIGVAAALHLAAAQPEPLRPAGLATTALLAGDLAQPSLVARGGWLAVPHGPGLGVELDSQALERWRQTDD
jgi:L-alanine-DL-glutamate epimerase-like enolase superfamily enzyme